MPSTVSMAVAMLRGTTWLAGRIVMPPPVMMMRLVARMGSGEVCACPSIGVASNTPTIASDAARRRLAERIT
jgi:hypothetical protein